MAYPTTAALVAASSAADLTSLTAEQQDALRLASIAAVEEYCGQSFAPVSKTVTLTGQGSEVLYLPERLATLDEVAVHGSTIDTAILALSDQRDRLYRSRTAGLGYYEQALSEWERHNEGLRPLFPLGDGMVEVTGTWGWLDADFPAAIGTAIRYDMEDTASADANLLTPTIAAFRKLGIRNISQGNLQADLSAAPGLTPRVTQLLTPYVWQGNVGALV